IKQSLRCTLMHSGFHALPAGSRQKSSIVQIGRTRACPRKARTYNAPMLDIKLIRERADFVRQRLALRGAGDENQVDAVLKFDEQRRKALAEVESLKAQRNRVSREIGALMAQKQADEAEAKKKETHDLGD